MYTIAVLLTCHNRRDKTITCLDSLYNCLLPSDFQLDVFLVDDGSSDGTSKAVSEKFPSVNVIQGNGNLFWNQGMRLAWDTASKTNKFDFYLWLNDDTVLDQNGIVELFDSWEEAFEKEKQSVLICGACRARVNTDIFSYGGRNEDGAVIPSGQIQKVVYINGNVVLVPDKIFQLVGNLSPDYTHALGDIDYGLRLRKENIQCYSTKKFIATCPNNEGLPDWCNQNKSFYLRWKSLYSPTGLNIKEYILFRKKFNGWKWIIYAAKVYLKVISPGLYGSVLSRKNIGI
jgi:GT2 family glycosyltransferase